jgi:hypothetical protein
VAEMSEETNKYLPRVDYFDPNDFYKKELADWHELWDDTKTLYENLREIVTTLVILLDPHIFLPIATTYLMQSTRPAKCLPVLASIGDPGSGKSTFTFLASQLRGIKQPYGVTDTFASVRNDIEARRYYCSNSREFTKEGVICCWDNLSIKMMKLDPKIYYLFLSGYHHRSSKIRTSKGGKENDEYDVFCPKVISTIDHIHTYPEYSELHRRLWVIPHKRLEDFTQDEKEKTRSQFSNLIEMESIDWSGFSSRFYDFWDDIDRCKEYCHYRAFLSKRSSKKLLDIPEILYGSSWDIAIDPICTGLCIGTWKDSQDAINAIALYLEKAKETQIKSYGAAIEYLKLWIENELKHNFRLDAQKSLDPKRLKCFIEGLSRSGEINERVTKESIDQWMFFLGYKLTTKGWIEK